MHQNKNQNNLTDHTPVLLSAALHYLQPQPGERYLDLTAGYGGHAGAVLQVTGLDSSSVLVDRDDQATAVLSDKFAGQATIIRDDFLTASAELAAQGEQFDLILADLGVSSPHLNTSSRGFAINSDGPLDMRMDQRQAVTAATIVNSYSQQAITDILKQYGEEPKARHIAQMIVDARPIDTTKALADIVSQAWPGYSRVHPATRTFQALRIAVNNELGLLEQSLPLWLQLLAPEGRLAIISFHSLEDRIVKNFLQDHSGNRYDADLRLLTKRPITAEPTELVSNPRARSAKLRAAAKIKT